jgi:RNA polymerase sigma factor (sigma-70 family)
MNDDALLRDYAGKQSQAAFSELVRRHVDLVYGAALRRTAGDIHLAEDVAQQVFTRLARDATRLSRHTVLAAWLHTATRNAALNLMISEQRRKLREQRAAVTEVVSGTSGDPAWEQLRPVLDAAIDELPESDRAAVVLRFFEQKPFAQIGDALRVSEDAARMRLDRALEKLRALLARRGIASTAVALGSVMANLPAASAPAGLAAELTAQTFAGAAGGITAAAGFFMSGKIITAGCVAGLLGLGLGYYFGISRAPATPRPVERGESELVAGLRHDNATLKAEIDRLNADRAALTARLAPAKTIAPPAPPAVVAEASPDTRTVAQKQQAMLNNLRQLTLARDQFQLENGRPPGSLDELVGEKNYVRRLTPVDGESYDGLPLATKQPWTVTTPAGLSVTFDPSGQQTTQIQPGPEEMQLKQAMQQAAQRLGPEGMQRIEASAKRALSAYRAANDGKSPPPTAPEALIPYFSTPEEGADYVEFIDAVKAAQRK